MVGPVGAWLDRFAPSLGVQIEAGRPWRSGQVEAYAESAGREGTRLGWRAFTCPLPLTGSPTATVPGGGTRDRLPVGWPIATSGLAERQGWRVAAACEAMAPWAQTRRSLDGARTLHHAR